MIKTKADSNDYTECSYRDHQPGTDICDFIQGGQINHYEISL